MQNCSNSGKPFNWQSRAKPWRESASEGLAERPHQDAEVLVEAAGLKVHFAFDGKGWLGGWNAPAEPLGSAQRRGE